MVVKNMSISKIAVEVCNWMDKTSHKNPEENEIIQYGLELLLDNVLKFILIQLIGIIIGMGKETAVVLFSFCGLRLQAGGKHAKTGIGCTLSMIAIWAASIICNMSIEIKISMMPYIYVFCTLLIIICAPRTINIQHFSLKDIWKKKVFSLVFLTLLLVVATLNSELRGLIVYPVFIEVITLLPRNKTNEKEKDENEKRNHYEISEDINKDFA
jgi:accessory gene regulator B